MQLHVPGRGGFAQKSPYQAVYCGGVFYSYEAPLQYFSAAAGSRALPDPGILESGSEQKTQRLQFIPDIPHLLTFGDAIYPGTTLQKAVKAGR